MENKKIKNHTDEHKKEATTHEGEGHSAHKGAKDMERENEGKKKTAECGCKYF